MNKPRIVVANSASFGRPPNADLWAALEEFATLARVDGIPDNADAATIVRALRTDADLPVHGLLASVTPQYPAGVVDLLPELVVMGRHGRGFDNMPLAAAANKGIPVYNVDGILEQASVAELTVALMVNLSRGIIGGHNTFDPKNWGIRKNFHGPEIYRRTVGVIGAGIIGRAVVRIVHAGMLGNVVVRDPGLTEAAVQEMGAEPVSLRELLERSDFISLTAAKVKGSPPILGEKELQWVKQGAFIVNTGRGTLWDEHAVIRALKDRRLGGVAVDVYPVEPPENSPFLEVKDNLNVILLPHLGGYGDDSKRAMGLTMVRVMQSVFTGNVEIPWANCVNGVTPQAFRGWKS